MLGFESEGSEFKSSGFRVEVPRTAALSGFRAEGLAARGSEGLRQGFGVGTSIVTGFRV